MLACMPWVANAVFVACVIFAHSTWRCCHMWAPPCIYTCGATLQTSAQRQLLTGTALTATSLTVGMTDTQYTGPFTSYGCVRTVPRPSYGCICRAACTPQAAPVQLHAVACNIKTGHSTAQHTVPLPTPSIPTIRKCAQEICGALTITPSGQHMSAYKTEMHADMYGC
jgi:hypothetical protein